MEYTHLLVRYGELFLKGKNRGTFELKLWDNIKAITGINVSIKTQGRAILPYFNEHASLKRVFGLSSYSPTVRVEQNTEAIKKALVMMLSGRLGMFRVVTNRADKRFPVKSPELNVLLGRHIESHTSLRFSLENAQILIGVEINQKGVFLFTETISCFGGLPTGVEGKVVLLLEDKASVLAGLLMMKRGVSVFPAGFHHADISLMQKYSPARITSKLVGTYGELEQYAASFGIGVMVTGEMFSTLRENKTSMMVLKPLVAYDAGRVEEERERFGKGGV